jgi:nucleoside-diphosphate-sugar epimerase
MSRGQNLQQDVHLWLERFIRACVDFLAVQCCAEASLALGGWQVVGAATLPGHSGDGLLASFYVRTFLPVSSLFIITNAYFALYTKSRGYTLQYKLRRATLSAILASSGVLFLCVQLNHSIRFSPMATMLFFVLSAGVIPGLRWLKDWMFHRESESSGREGFSNVDTAVLVVGGAGYIGSLVIEKLLARGYKIRLLDNLVYGDEAIRKLLSNPRLEFIKGDCRSIQDVVRAMTNVRNMIHLAAIVGDPACAEDGENASQINYAATRMMAEIAAGQGIERFVYASTCSIYGASDNLMDENSETNPISLYARTKLQSEQVLLDARSKSFHPSILRFATVFGLSPRPRFDLVVNLLTAKAVQEKVITIFNGEQWRPFLHVQDVAEAVVQVFLAPLESISGEIFNVGDDRLNYTLRQIAEKIRQQLPQTSVEYVENSDRRNYRVSFRKIRQRIGFRAQRTVESGINEIVEAFRTRQISNYGELAYNNLAFLKAKGRVDAKDELDVKVMAAFASAGSRSTQAAHTMQRGTVIPPRAAEGSGLGPAGSLDIAISGAPAE